MRRKRTALLLALLALLVITLGAAMARRPTLVPKISPEEFLAEQSSIDYNAIASQHGGAVVEADDPGRALRVAGHIGVWSGFLCLAAGAGVLMWTRYRRMFAYETMRFEWSAFYLAAVLWLFYLVVYNPWLQHARSAPPALHWCWSVWRFGASLDWPEAGVLTVVFGLVLMLAISLLTGQVIKSFTLLLAHAFRTTAKS